MRDVVPSLQRAGDRKHGLPPLDPAGNMAGMAKPTKAPAPRWRITHRR
jgi:hypothetical protein